MSGVWAAVPAKPFSQAKSRLAAALGREGRRVLARNLLVRTLEVLVAHKTIAAVCVVSSSPSVLKLGAGLGALPMRERGRAAGLNRALDAASRRAREGGAEAVLVLPADLPLLSAADIEAMIAALPDSGPGLVLAPDLHGSGTNALLARPAGVVGHHFGDGSFEAHWAAARKLSIACAVVETPGLALDVDSQDDLELLPPRLLAALSRRPCEPA